MAATSTSRRRQQQRLGRALGYVLLAVTGGLVVNLLVGDSGLLAMLAADRQYADLQARTEALRLQNEALREDARRLRDDPGRIEEVARGELGLMRPGERVFIIRPEDPDPAPPPHRSPLHRGR